MAVGSKPYFVFRVSRYAALPNVGVKHELWETCQNAHPCAATGADELTLFLVKNKCDAEADKAE